MFNYVQFSAIFHLLIQKCLGGSFFWTHGGYQIDVSSAEFLNKFV